MKILVADDEQAIVDLMSEYLDAAGHEVVSAYDADSLVKLVAEAAPGLIFLDINMPGIRDDGMSPAIEIPAAIKRIPVVAITGNEKKKVYAMGLPANIEIIQKPINFPEVDAVLAKFAPAE
ncbi:MAG: hypothetical protein COT18_06245 [Elusimicrobia bacterium CG08_land_8_20_14_0_20_59_10]|nr:MAG: hypothetical protein COT18_06245 [Elusimicrobia bacterium CG08_land_8_20_14_0_20_59_10]